LAQRAHGASSGVEKEKLQVEMVEIKKRQDKETGGGRLVC